MTVNSQPLKTRGFLRYSHKKTSSSALPPAAPREPGTGRAAPGTSAQQGPAAELAAPPKEHPPHPATPPTTPPHTPLHTPTPQHPAPCPSFLRAPQARSRARAPQSAPSLWAPSVAPTAGRPDYLTALGRSCCPTGTARCWGE